MLCILTSDVVFPVHFRLDCSLTNQLVSVHRQQGCLVSSQAPAAQAFLSHRHSHNQRLEVVCLVQKQRHLQALEVLEQREPLALVRMTFSCIFARVALLYLCDELLYDMIQYVGIKCAF